jgi:hypothetical protein
LYNTADSRIDTQSIDVVFDGAFEIAVSPTGNSPVVKLFNDLKVALIGLVSSWKPERFRVIGVL